MKILKGSWIDTGIKRLGAKMDTKWEDNSEISVRVEKDGVAVLSGNKAGLLTLSRLPRWTYNKAISKICDSYRVDKEMKGVVRGMRKGCAD